MNKMTKMKKYELIFRIGSERPSDFPKATERRSMHLKPPSVLSNHPRSGQRSQGPHITKAAYSPGDTPPMTARCWQSRPHPSLPTADLPSAALRGTAVLCEVARWRQEAVLGADPEPAVSPLSRKSNRAPPLLEPRSLVLLRAAA